MRKASMRVACAALALAFALAPVCAPPALADDGAIPDEVGCGLSGGALTLNSADTSDGDFAVFGLFDASGDRLARQYVPVYNPDAQPELMLSTIGSGDTVASAKCLAETSLQRCADPSWQPVDDGVAVSLIGFLLGDDYALISARARFKSPVGAAAQPLDGTSIGFAIDKDPVRWSVLFDSQTQVSQGFFSLARGPHSITIGTRDIDKDTLVPQDRICFKT